MKRIIINSIIDIVIMFVIMCIANYLFDKHDKLFIIPFIAGLTYSFIQELMEDWRKRNG